MQETELFDISQAERIVEHPDTPAAYTDWSELIPLTGSADREHLGNVLGWSHRRASTPLGASREVFERAFEGVGERLLDRWMQSLAETPSEDFLQHHIPFLRNASAFVGTHDMDTLVERYVDVYQEPRVSGVGAEQLYRVRPDVVHLEITRSCNFACGMCSSRTDGWLPERTMPLEVFGEMVRVLGEHASTLRINGYGETTIVPELESYLDCLDEFEFAGLREIITNLSGSKEIYDELVDRGFVIMASWDSTDEDRFEWLRAGSDFQQMEETLRRVAARLGEERERLLLLSTLQEENAEEVQGLVRFAEEAGAGGVIFNMVNEGDGSPWMMERFDELVERFEEALELGRELDLHVSVPDHIQGRRTGVRKSKRSSATFCDRPWVEALVRYDTEMTVCNMFNPFSYGMLVPPGPPQDVPSRLDRMWNGPNASLFREIINTDERHPYCEDCYFLHGAGAGART